MYFSLKTSLGPSGVSCAIKILSPRSTTRTLSTFLVPSGDGPGIFSSSRPMELGGASQTKAGKTSETALKAKGSPL